MSEGSKTVRRGTESSKLYLSLLNSFRISLVASITTPAAMKLIHSNSMLSKLAMGTPKPYHVCVIGQNSCIPPPVNKSPIRMCCINAAK